MFLKCSKLVINMVFIVEKEKLHANSWSACTEKPQISVILQEGQCAGVCLQLLVYLSLYYAPGS